MAMSHCSHCFFKVKNPNDSACQRHWRTFVAVMVPTSLEGESIIAKQHISYCLFLLLVGRRTWLALFEESYPFSLSLNILSYALLFLWVFLCMIQLFQSSLQFSSSFLLFCLFFPPKTVTQNRRKPGIQDRNKSMTLDHLSRQNPMLHNSWRPVTGSNQTDSQNTYLTCFRITQAIK